MKEQQNQKKNERLPRAVFLRGSGSNGANTLKGVTELILGKNKTIN